jgi:hypothetical protein
MDGLIMPGRMLITCDGQCRRNRMPRACRVADACEHAELTAQPEIGAAIHAARLPAMCSDCIGPHWRFEPVADVAVK